jgi:hypothetical protein
MKKLISITLLTFFCSAQASVVMQINGKLKKSDQTNFEVEDGKKTYIISKDKLTVQQIKQLSEAKSGSDIKMSLPMTAITDVKTKN